jgi:hypothetical protein
MHANAALYAWEPTDCGTATTLAADLTDESRPTKLPIQVRFVQDGFKPAMAQSVDLEGASSAGLIDPISLLMAPSSSIRLHIRTQALLPGPSC